MASHEEWTYNHHDFILKPHLISQIEFTIAAEGFG
jgi:hypothetical protein